MTGVDFILSVAASLVAAAVDRALADPPDTWHRRRIDRRIESMTNAVTEPLAEYLKQEKLSEDSIIQISREAAKPVRSLIDHNDEMIARGLNIEAVVNFILEELLDASAREIANEHPAAFDTMLRAFVDLAVRTPPLFADWEQKQFTATYEKLEELEDNLSRIYGDMKNVVARHEQDESLIDKIIIHQAGRLALKMSLHGLRTSELPQTDIDNLYVVPNLSCIDDDGIRRPLQHDYFTTSRTSVRCVVIAPAGAGKTTWIEWLGSQLLQNSRESALPVTIRLRQAMRSTQLPTLTVAVRAASPAFRDKIETQDVERWAINGRLQLLLDGFDEVPEARRDEVWNWINDLAAADPSINIVLTTRPLTTHHVRSAEECGYVAMTLEPFEDEQVEEYISRFQEFGPPIQTGAQKLSPADLARNWRHDPSLEPLTANPLLLSTLLAVHHMDGELPQGRAPLYERYVDGMLGAWENKKELSPPDIALTKQTKRAILEAIAINIFANEMDAVDEDEVTAWIGPCLEQFNVTATVRVVLEHLRERSGLLVGPGQYSFAHKTIGEFLVACACQNGIARDTSGQRYDRMLVTRKSDEDRWRMVVLFWAGLAPAADVQTHIKDLIVSRRYSLANGLLVEHGERLDAEHRAKIVWKFVCGVNTVRLQGSPPTDGKEEFSVGNTFAVPLVGAVTSRVRSLQVLPIFPDSNRSRLPQPAFERGWIDPRDWDQHIDVLSTNDYLYLLREIGNDKKLRDHMVKPISEEEQITWLAFWITAGIQDRVAYDPTTLQNHPSGVWRGIAMAVAITGIRWADNIQFWQMFGSEDAEPTRGLCEELCTLEIDDEGNKWVERISEELSKVKDSDSAVYIAAKRLEAGYQMFWSGPSQPRSDA